MQEMIAASVAIVVLDKQPSTFSHLVDLYLVLHFLPVIGNADRQLTCTERCLGDGKVYSWVSARVCVMAIEEDSLE